MANSENSEEQLDFQKILKMWEETDKRIERNAEVSRREAAELREFINNFGRKTDIRLEETSLKVKDVEVQYQATGRKIKYTDFQLEKIKKIQEEISISQKEGDRQFQEMRDKSSKEYEEIRSILRESALARIEGDKQFQEMKQEFREQSRKFREESDEQYRKFKEQLEEDRKESRELSRKIKEQGIQLGGLGNKWGTFNEGLYTPSMLKILTEKYNCFYAATNFRMWINNAWYELDVWGESEDTFYIVEIKSHLREDAIEQLEEEIRVFSGFNEKHKTKKKYGMIVATYFKEPVKQKVLDAGFYFFSVTDNIAKISVPKGFKPIAR